MLKHEESPGLAKITALRQSAEREGRRHVSILVGNGGLHYPQELARGVDGAMTGFAFPEMLVEVYKLHAAGSRDAAEERSEEHTSELQSLMRKPYAVFCLEKKKQQQVGHTTTV